MIATSSKRKRRVIVYGLVTRYGPQSVASATWLNITRNCYHGVDVIYTIRATILLYNVVPNEVYFLYALYVYMYIYIAFIARFSINFRFASLHCPAFKQILRDQRGRVATNGQFLPGFNSRMLLSFFLPVHFIPIFQRTRNKKKKKEKRKKNLDTGGNTFLSLHYLHYLHCANRQAVCLSRDEIPNRSDHSNFGHCQRPFALSWTFFIWPLMSRVTGHSSASSASPVTGVDLIFTFLRDNNNFCNGSERMDNEKLRYKM